MYEQDVQRYDAHSSFCPEHTRDRPDRAAFAREHSDSLLLRARHEVGESRFSLLDADDGDVVASLSKDNLLGLAWTLRGVDETRLARIRFGVSLTDTPVSFEVELGEEAISEQESESQLSNYLFQSLNLNIVECLPVSGEPFSSYSTLAHDNQSQSYAHVHDSLGRLTTRAPLWNSEANCYLSNFGSRVRVTANTNFILVPRDFQSGGELSCHCEVRAGAEKR